MNVEGRTILLASGRYVDPLELGPDDIGIDDVAHALSHQCRFSGHTRVFYSVAEHSARVTAAAMLAGHPAEVTLWCLLHDAPEAFLVDLPSPLKQDSVVGDAFKAAEGRVMHAVKLAFGLMPFEPPAVKEFDLRLLATERRDLMPPGGDWSILRDVEPLPARILPLSSIHARVEFLQLFDQLAPLAEATL